METHTNVPYGIWKERPTTFVEQLLDEWAGIRNFYKYFRNISISPLKQPGKINIIIIILEMRNLRHQVNGKEEQN
jgi:hypothetical protein